MIDGSLQAFLEEIQTRTGLDADGAMRSASAVLGTLGERLDPRSVAALAAVLPEAFADILRRRERPGRFRPVEFHARVAWRAGVLPRFGPEHSGVVCAVLAEIVPDRVLRAVRARLPRELRLLFSPPERPDESPPHAEGHGRTLATGRPGGRRPLSEARPREAQADSVVRSKEPHADRKLSSAKELVGETLSTGRPGSRRPLSESRG